MKKLSIFGLAGLLLIVTGGTAAFGQESEPEEKYSIWVGSHYTGYSDYAKKVGEFNFGDDEKLFPEFKIDYLSRGKGHIFALDGHYFDEKNIDGDVSVRIGDEVSGNFRYRSFVRQEGQDLLANLETREAGGGKILTHEILDPGADYNTHRKEMQSNVNILLSSRHNLKLMAAHRMVLQTGTEQKISSNHCFSCHITSDEARVDKIAHHFVAGLQGDVGESTIGYQFGYRLFNSEAPDPYAYYDEAKHPVTGESGAEFSSRMVYDDTTISYGIYPKTEKFSHKLRFNSKVGGGDLATSVSYSTTTDKKTDLSSTAWVGSAMYAVPVSTRSRIIAKLIATKFDTDDYYIDLPLFREGRTGTQTDFDINRKSSLTRIDLRGSLELISQLSQRITASLLLGYNRIDRDDYPIEEEGLASNKLIGQFKIRYRKGLRYSTYVKYRFEKTSDPFLSGRGLFEARGRDILDPIPESFRFVFYFQREDLRYQDITTVPTQTHIFEWNSNWRPDKKFNVMVGLKGRYDKNGDLDSLDVNHLRLQPHMTMNLTPAPKWSVSAGGSYAYFKSRGPVTVALFDG